MRKAQIELVIDARQKEIAGFPVRRLLPWAKRRSVGPFVFLDQMGPHVLPAGKGLDVLPHPHIGLSTLTYLFDGELMHRDSLGSVQRIVPGEVNLMTAGRGVVHSERTPESCRDMAKALFGIQMWLALPGEYEESDPRFHHYSADSLPVIEELGSSVRLIVGEIEGVTSPVRSFSRTFYAEVRLEARAQLRLPEYYDERAVYVVEGEILVDEKAFSAGTLVVFEAGEAGVTATERGTRLMLLGGEPLDGPRHIEWNFVSSSKERVEQAKADWSAGRFSPIPNETGFIPLPEKQPGQGSADVDYP